MKIWILGALALLLLLLAMVRERFEATPSIKAPPYGKEEKLRLFGLANEGDQSRLLAKAKQQTPAETNQETLKETAGGFLAPSVGDFFTGVFKPATQPITPAEIRSFMTTRSSDISDIEERVLTTYFIGQSGVGTSQKTGYADVLAKMGQGPGYLTTGPPPSGGMGGPPPGAGGEAAVTGGTTTGGTSDSSFGPNSGGFAGMGDRRKQVFGPIAMGQGNPDGSVVPMDSSKTNNYPELLGGTDSRPSTRIEGAGIVAPSKNWQLSNNGSLPTDESLKSSVPGDKDLIPDPYRLSQQFSAASYSFKTDPVPFLTDFSAFQK